MMNVEANSQSPRRDVVQGPRLPKTRVATVSEERVLRDAQEREICRLHAVLEQERHTSLEGKNYRNLQSIELVGPDGRRVDLVGLADLEKPHEIQVYDEKLGFEGKHKDRERCSLVTINLPDTIFGVAVILHELGHGKQWEDDVIRWLSRDRETGSRLGSSKPTKPLIDRFRNRMPYVCESIDANEACREYYSLQQRDYDMVMNEATDWGKYKRHQRDARLRNLFSFNPIGAGFRIWNARNSLVEMDAADKAWNKENDELHRRSRELEEDEFIAGIGRLPKWLTELDANRRSLLMLEAAGSKIGVDLLQPFRKDDYVKTPEKYLADGVASHYDATPEKLIPYNIKVGREGITQIK